MRLRQLAMPPLAAGTSWATVKANELRPLTGLPPLAASLTLKTTVGVTGAVEGMVTEVMVAKLRASALAAAVLCSAIESAICPALWQRVHVSCVCEAWPGG